MNLEEEKTPEASEEIIKKETIIPKEVTVVADAATAVAVAEKEEEIEEVKKNPKPAAKQKKKTVKVKEKKSKEKAVATDVKAAVEPIVVAELEKKEEQPVTIEHSKDASDNGFAESKKKQTKKKAMIKEVIASEIEKTGEQVTTPEAKQVEILEEELAEKESEKRQKTENDQVKKPNEKKKRTILLSFLGVAVLVLVFLMSTLFAVVNIMNANIMEGIHIKGIDVSNMSREAATKKLEEVIELEFKNSILLKSKEYETSLLPEQIEIKYDLESAVKKAYDIGRTGNIFQNNYAILGALLTKPDISPTLSYEEEALDELIQDIAKKIPGAVEESNYYIEEEYLIITKGFAGLEIEENKLKEAILNSIQTVNKEYIEIPTRFKEPNPIDIDKIYEEVKREPQDAYYEANPHKVVPHVDGIDFKLSLEEVRLLLQEDKQEYMIELKFITPAKTTDQIGTEAFPDLLGVTTTKYDSTNRNRTTNLELAAGKIHGTVVMPGETFSYNKVVGKRTIEAGYKEAAIYENGRVVDGLGGGICQISSTLYDAVVFANLEIVERSNHQFITSYLGAGKDATVVYGAIDFKFKNTREYPIKIICDVNSGVAKISIFGVKQDVEYKIEMQTTILGYISFTTKYEENPNLDAGVEKTIQNGAQGCTSITYKVLYLNGAEVSRAVLSKDTYSAMAKIIQRGTRGQHVVEPEPEPPPPTTELPPVAEPPSGDPNGTDPGEVDNP